MKKLILAVASLFVSTACSAQAPDRALDENAVFTAAGFSQQDNAWHKCDDPGTASYTPGAIQDLGDLNGDGLPEALVTEGSSFCYGMTGTAFTLVSQQASGDWRAMAEEVGVAVFLETRGTDNWPDLQVGGPGFCFPVLRWNGKEYAMQRHEYDGRACQP